MSPLVENPAEFPLQWPHEFRHTRPGKKQHDRRRLPSSTISASWSIPAPTAWRAAGKPTSCASRRMSASRRGRGRSNLSVAEADLASLCRLEPGGLEMDAEGGRGAARVGRSPYPPSFRRHAPGRIPAEAAGGELPGDRQPRRRHQGHGAQDPGDQPGGPGRGLRKALRRRCCSAAPRPWKPRAATAWTWKPS